MQSPSFFVTESDPRFNQQKQLTVTEAGRAVRVETDLPHLVSLGSGRFSTSVTLHPLPEGKTTVGCMNADIIVRGRGIHPEHCYFIHERDIVILFPISQLITVDGAKVTRPTILSQGTMICFGRSSYFRFNHPAEAQHLKREHFDIYNDTYSTSGLFSKREPLYANEEMSNSSATSTTEGSVSIPLYDNVGEIKAALDQKTTNGDSQSTICDSPDHDQTLPRSLNDSAACSPLRPLGQFHSSFMRMFPDGSRRSADNQFFSHGRISTSDLFDERASHIPRPLSPTLEDLNLANWTGYDNVLELKENLKKQESRDQISPEKSNLKFQRQSLHKPNVSLIKCNEKFNPTSVGAFIGNTECSSPKIEHDLILRKQASEPLDKRKVTFSIKEEISSTPIANNPITQEVSSKPPSGKNATEHSKKLESKREKRFAWNKRNTSPATTTTEISDIPTTKPSFFKALMRSRSPSPTSKRCPSPTAPINSDVARRLSEPLKESFKAPDSSLKEKFVGMKSNRDDSSSSDEESVNSKSSIHISSTNSSTNTSQSNSTLKDPSNPSQDRSSSERVVTIRAINTTDDEKTCSSLLTEQQPIICNPWKVNLKSCNVNISFDNYKGEKLFSRDTVTTTVTVPGVAAYQASCSNTGVTQVSSATGTKPTVEIQPQSRQMQNNGNPIYDRVYDSSKEGKMNDHKLDRNSNSPKTTTERKFSEDILKFIDGNLTDEIVIGKNTETIPEVGFKISDDEQNRNSTSQSTSSTSLIKVTTHTSNNNNDIPEPTQPLSKSTRSDDQINKMRTPCVNHGSSDLFSIDVASGSNSRIDLNQSGVNGKSVMFNETPRIIDEKSIRNNYDVTSKRTFQINGDEFISSEKAISSSSREYSVPSKVVRTNCGVNDAGVVTGKPPICENNSKTMDDEMSALFGVRRGVLRRMKMLKQKIEEIEEKERNIENLITRNSMSIDVLEKKQISEKDIKDFFTNATNVLDNLEEEGRKVEYQFVEANEYLTRINKTIGEMEKKKKQNNNNNNISDGDDNDDVSTSTTIRTFDSKVSSPPDSVLPSTPSTTLDVKMSSGSSDNSSFGSASLLGKSIKTTKGSIGSLTAPDKSATAGMFRSSTCRPLTRYFPVTDSSFDLKCYIELSGHNLDISKTVHVESYRCCGYLSKMGRKWKKWHRRWFVFDRTKRHLACYLTEPHNPSQQPRSSYYFQSIRDVFADHLHMVKSPNPDFTFCVKLAEKNLFLMASGADAMRIWIDVLFTGAEGYQDVS